MKRLRIAGHRPEIVVLKEDGEMIKVVLERRCVPGKKEELENAVGRVAEQSLEAERFL